MSEWAAKRFWKAAAAVEVEGGYSVELDGRSIKTPAKTLVVVPTLAVAQAMAVEWDAQGEKIDPMLMPVTRAANAALDKVRHQKAEVADMLAAYGDSDLVCYRADSPQGLVEAQNEGWDPLIAFAADRLNAPLEKRVGIMHEPQAPATLESLSGQVQTLDPFELAAFHDLVALSGSLIIGFAAIYDFLPIETLWERSRIDEQWQINQWGEDEEAAELAEIKRIAFLNAKIFYGLLQA